MKSLLFILFIPIFFLSADQSLSQIDEDITLSRQKIRKKEDEKNRITTMLQKLGNEINQKNNQLKRLDSEIRVLQDLINNNQGKNQTQEKMLNQYQKLLKSLQQKRYEIKDKITQILINDLAFVMILNSQNPISPDDLILQEYFKLLSQHSQEKLKILTQEEKLINQKITETMEAIAILDRDITSQTNQKNYLQNMQNMQKKLIANLQKDLQKYNQRLKQNDAERKSLDEILKRLNIVKASKEKELLEQQRKKALQEKEEMAKKAITPSSIPAQPIKPSPIDVKQVANSYQQLSVAKYNGARTISPIESYEIEQKFGTYFDPVYKLKVFNESIILASKTPNVPVRSIFDGKIVYAKEVPILKKVVIIENQNGIHTIYSQLDKIAPTIKVGLYVKKGYVIGRVDQKLSFEITQKDKHINPLEVIAKSK